MEAWRWREFLLLLTAFVFSVGFASGGFLLLLVLAAGETLAGEPLWRRTPVDAGLLGLVAATVLSGLWSEWRGTALWSAVAFGLSAAVTLRAVVLAVHQRPVFARRFIGAWAAGGVAAGALGIAWLGPAPGARAQVFNMNPNELGTTMAIAAVMLLGLSLDGPRLRRLLCLAGLSVATAGLVLTWSRGAWLAAVLGVGVLVARTERRLLWPGMLAAALVMVAAIPTLGPRWEWHAGRIQETTAADGPFSRIPIWRLVPKMVADHPVLGTGLSTFQFVYERYRQGSTAVPHAPLAHNLFLQAAAETGLVGLVALLFFLTTGVLAVARWHTRGPPGSEQRRLSATALAAFVALLAHQMVDGTVLRIHIAVGLFALVGLGAAFSPGAGERAP
ncbi:MAG: O-antigen ligase family protein [Armatimonadetes bacterium]|nr:O-antigen ligase family protein [Armatimonadota bacterium]